MPEILSEYEALGGMLASIERISFEVLLRHGVQVLDVRRADKFAELHLPGKGVRLIPPPTRLLERSLSYPTRKNITPIVEPVPEPHWRPRCLRDMAMTLGMLMVSV